MLELKCAAAETVKKLLTCLIFCTIGILQENNNNKKKTTIVLPYTLLIQLR